MLRPSAWVLLLAALPGCERNVDLVAREVGDQGARDSGAFITDVQVVEPCMAGSYVGAFWTDNGAFAFSGTINFALRTRAGEDTLTIESNSKLFGEDELTGATITADVIGGGRCTSGDFDSRLENGTFTQTGSTPVLFEGVVTGDYLAEGAFLGDWAATAFGQPVGEGQWYAMYVPPPPVAP